MGVTNRRTPTELPAVTGKTGLGTPGMDQPKQVGSPAGAKPVVGIQTNKIKRGGAPKAPMNAGIGARPSTAGGQTAAGASSAAPNKKNKDVFELEPKKWQKVLSKYGIKDL